MYLLGLIFCEKYDKSKKFLLKCKFEKFDSLTATTLYRCPGSSRAGRLGRTLWPQNSTSVAETEKGGQNSTMTPPTLEKGGQYSTSVWKVCKKRGSKIYNSKKNRGQNSTSLKMGVKILHAEKKGSKFYNAWKKGGQYSTSDPKSRGQNST